MVNKDFPAPTIFFFQKKFIYKRSVIWTTIFVDNPWDNLNIQRNMSVGTKIKAIERESKNKMWVMRDKVVTKVIKKWLFKYHFTIYN